MNNRNVNVCPWCNYHYGENHDANCIYGRYFPPERATDLENACRLFGFSNLLRLMHSVRPNEREATANSILREGSVWTNDPVQGVLGKEFTLTSQIESFERELESTNKLLNIIEVKEPPSSSNLMK
ncbi:hypothetical protein RJT34_01728 [Clitoria ternatea]|uniref:LOB domain-containing protein n=1 Tax=Clitoria ternatea TaxID=43366 RepID=A0AAN9PYN2_CLITE